MISGGAKGAILHRRISAGVLTARLLIGCTAGSPAPKLATEVRHWLPYRIALADEQMPSLLKRWSVPGVSIALVADNKLQWSAGFGKVAVGGTSVTPSTVFQAASLGKPVFAGIVSAAADEHGLALEDPLRTWLGPAELQTQFLQLSAQQLLAHSAGVVFNSDADRIDVDPDSAGEWAYSGAGYAVLQVALERTLDRSLVPLAQDYVFGPLAMDRSTFVTSASAEPVEGHDRRGRPIKAMEWTQPNSGSSLYTTVADYANFIRNVMAEAGNRGFQSFDAIVSVDNELKLAWGLGWALELWPEREPIVFHWGSNPGFKSFAMVDSVRNLGVVILTNGDNGLELVEEVMKLLDPMNHPMFDFYMMHPDD